MPNEETVKIKVDQILLAIASVCAAATFLVIQGPYTVPFVFTVLFLILGSYYSHSARGKVSEMCCMMSGMAFGMLSGFFVGAIAALIANDFFIGMVIGAVAGVLFGIAVGRSGGPLGHMEGVMAGPMGGMMGAMTGIMIQFSNLQLFMPFLVIVVVLSTWEMMRVIKKETQSLPRHVIYAGILLSVVAIASTFASSYSAVAAGPLLGVAQAAQLNGEVQEVSIQIHALSYEPDYITLKKDVPVRLTLTADRNAGCTRDFVFSEYKIRKLVAPGTTQIVEFTPTKAGTFQFNCAMNMARGIAVVQ